jgi:outer membrane protein assembly factor BamB
VYNKSGEYTVTLFVTDGVGGWGKVNDTCKVKVSKGPPLANSPWPKFRGNLRNTGLSPYDTSNNSGKLKWTFTPDDYIFSSPVIDTNGTIYFGSRDYKLYAINQNGTHRWNFTTGYEIHSTPAISSDGTIYVGSNDFKLYAINPNGSMKWSFATGDWVKSPPAIGPDGTIYVGSNDGKLYAINPNGTQKWNFTSGYVIDSSPAIGSDGTIYCNVYIDSILYAINPNGTMKWSYKLGGPSHSSPAIGPDGTIYVGSTDMNIYAIKQDGTKKWSFKTYDGVFSSPAIGSDGTIYIGSKDSKIYAIYPNGNEKWSFSTNSGIYTSPAIDSKGILYLGADDGELYAINPNGSQKWSYSTRHWVDSSPAIGSDGSVYICSGQVLHAIGTKPSNHPPIANAGPDQNVTVNQTVNLDGSSSYDPDEDDLTYQWDFGDGSSTDWQNSATITHSYSESGDYIVTLTVSDGSLTDSETCTIYVSEVIKPYPIIAENFPTLIELDEDFGKFSQQLTDFESHWDSEIIGDNLKWYVTGNSDKIFHVSGDNSTGGNADTIIFDSIVNEYGTEVIAFHLHDPISFEAVINQTVIVHPVNDPPISNAGPDQNITIGQTINLNGNGSYDAEGDILLYEWTSNINRKLGSGVVLKDIKLSVGIHTITLTVGDGELINIDTCIVQVSNFSVNLPPVANIKPIIFALEGEKVNLSAADSFDSDGYITTYIWDFGDNSEEVITNTSEVEHTWSFKGNYTITLTVIDNQGLKDSVSLDIIVAQSKTIKSDNDDKKSQNNTFALILVAIVIIILLLIASLKIFLSRSKRQREQTQVPKEDILSEMKHKFLQDEPLSEMEYSRNEISEILERKFKTGQFSEDTYHFIRSEVLFSDEPQTDQIINSKPEGKE